jgi:DNA-directed RNA polymerase sigma subunit (sigma70/sigma32)
MSEMRCRYNDELVLSKRELEALLGPMTDTERIVVSYRFGFIDGIVHSLRETGDLCGTSREQVRRVEAWAFRRVRSASR